MSCYGDGETRVFRESTDNASLTRTRQTYSDFRQTLQRDEGGVNVWILE